MGVGFGEGDDAIDVAFEGWAVDAVGSEEVLRLSGVVELFDEEVRDGVVRQARDAWGWWQHQEEAYPLCRRGDLRAMAINGLGNRVEELICR